MSDLREVVVVSAKRTPVGSFQGVYQQYPPLNWVVIVIASLLDETKIDLNRN